MKKTKSHPRRLANAVYKASDLDKDWNYLLEAEKPLLEKAIERLKAEELGLRQKLREAAEQSTENIGHDDATQESIRLTLWTLTSRLDHLRDAHIHLTIVPGAIEGDKRVTFGSLVALNGPHTLKVCLVGAADLPIERSYVPEGYTPVSYLSPVGGAVFGRKLAEEVTINGKTYAIAEMSKL